MKVVRAALAAMLAAGATGCAGHDRSAANVHYTVGRPYQVAGFWHYPREQFEYDETGLATVTTRRHGTTADGERFDPVALTAAHPTLQLPAVLRVTALDTGRQILVRVNDRGPTEPGRLIALTPRALALLGDPSHAPIRVRVEVEEGMSRQLAAALGGDAAPRLVIAAAPEAEVKQEALAAPGQPLAAAPPPAAKPASAGDAAPPKVPLRLPETVFQVPSQPGALFVDAGRFATARYAAIMQDRLRAYGAFIDRDAGDEVRVRIGPLGSVAEADATLRKVIAAGYPDAHIVAD